MNIHELFNKKRLFEFGLQGALFFAYQWILNLTLGNVFKLGLSDLLNKNVLFGSLVAALLVPVVWVLNGLVIEVISGFRGR